MTATEIIQLLAVVQSLTPVISRFVKELTGEDIAVENLTVAELIAMKERLEVTDPNNWPEFKFQSPNKD